MPKIDKTAPVKDKTYVVTSKYMHIAVAGAPDKVVPQGGRVQGNELPPKLLRHYLQENWLCREEDWEDGPEGSVTYAETDEIPDDAAEPVSA